MTTELLETYRQGVSALLAESRERMGRRDLQIYTSLAVSGGAAGFGLTSGPQVAMLAALGLPLALFALGFLAVSDDRRVSEIDDCIKRVHAPAIEAELARLHGGLLPEERLALLPWYRGWRKHYRGRPRRKVLRLTMMLIVFSAAGLSGPILFLLLAPASLLWVLAVVDLILIAVLTAEIIVSAEVWRAKRSE